MQEAGVKSNLDFLSSDGELAELIRNFDWSKTPLGAPEYWSPSLQSTISEQVLKINNRPALEAASAQSTPEGLKEIEESALKNSTLAAIVQSSEDAIVSKTLEGIVTSWNPGAQKLFGFTPDEMIGQPITKVIPDDRLDEEPQILQKIQRGEIVDHFETKRKTKSGQIVDISLTISPIRNEEGKIIGASKIGRDISHHKRTEANLAFLAEISRDLVQLNNPAAMLQVIGEKIAAFFGITTCAFISVDEPAGQVTVLQDWHQANAMSLVGTYRVADYLEEEVISLLKADEMYIIRDKTQDARLKTKKSKSGLSSALSIPYLQEGELLYVLSIYDALPRNWRQGEIELMRELCMRIWTRFDQLKAEQALQKSEAKYRSLFNSLDEGFCIIKMLFDENGKPYDYRFVEANDSLAQQTGLVNTIGKTMNELVPAHEQYWFDIYGKIAKTGEPARFENEAKALGHHYEVYAFRVGAPEEHQVAVLFKDIRVRKQEEEKKSYLLKLSDALRDLTTSAEIKETACRVLGEHLGVIRAMYADSFIKDGVEYFQNVGQYSTDLPYSPEPIPAEHIKTATAPLYEGKISVISDVLKEIPAAEQAAYLHFNIRSFIAVPLLKNGKPVLIFGVHEDHPRIWREDEIELVKETAERTWTTAEKIQAEEELKKSEANFAAMFEALPVGAALIDTHGKLVLSNERMRIYVPNNVIPSRDPERFQRWVGRLPDGSLLDRNDFPGARALRGEHVVQGVEMLYTQDDGQKIWTNVAAVPIKDATGEVSGQVTVVTDITQLKQATDALQQSTDTLAQDLRSAQWLHALSERLVSASTLQLFYNEVVNAAMALTGADAGTVQMLEEKTQQLVMLQSTGFDEKVQKYFYRVDATSGTSCGLALVNNERTFVDFDEGLADPSGSLKIHRDAGYLSAQSTPLVTRTGKPIGMVSTHWHRHHRPSERELRFLDLLARQTADLLERKQQEEKYLSQLESDVQERTSEISKQKDFIETIINSTPDLVTAYGTDFRIIAFNKACEDFFNLKSEAVMGRTFTEVFPSGKGGQGEKDLVRAFQGETIHNAVYHSPVTKKYYENYISPLRDEKGNIYAAVAISHDITDNINATEYLKQSEEKFNKLFAASPLGLVLSEIPSGKIVDVNEIYCETIGYSKAECVGKTSLELDLIEENARQKIVDELLQNGFVKNAEVEIIKKDGEKIPALNSIEKITIGDKEYLLSALIDITERKNAERKIEEKNHELQKMNKELEAFTYISSHDLQEPLRKIQTFAGRILEKEEENLSDTAKGYFSRMADAAIRMQSLIQDLLHFSRLTTTERKFELTDLHGIVEDVKTELKEVIETKGAFVEATGFHQVNIIPFQFRQLLYNLISNALKFSKSDVQPHIIINSEIVSGADSPLGGQKAYLITVSDNGIGFEKHFSEKIFEVFQKLHSKDQYEGTGIGLAIVKKIVENHRGRITASGELNQGATFNIYIPA